MNTAVASVPLDPMNQACVGSGSPLPNSAVPVLPKISWPGTFARVPLPPVTTPRISPRSVSRTPESIDVGSGASSSGWSGSSAGGSQVPSMTVPATVAMCSGLAVTRPCPMAAAAFSVSSAGSG
jgi:hypothetical protein